MFRCAKDLNVYSKTAMHWFQFPQIQELTSSTVASLIWQCYSYLILVPTVVVTFVALGEEI